MDSFRVMTPIVLDNGKTVWNKVGVAFKNSDSSKKHEMVISITALPLSMFVREEVKLYVFQDTEYKGTYKPQHKDNDTFRQSPPMDDDVPF